MRQLRILFSLLLLGMASCLRAQELTRYNVVDSMTFITQDSITYGVVADGTVGVYHIEKHSAVIPSTITKDGTTYTVGGICCNPEAIGENVATITFPDTEGFDNFYHTKGATWGMDKFYFSAGTKGKNLQKFSWPDNSTTAHETLFVNYNDLYVKPSASDTIAYIVCIPAKQSTSRIVVHPLSVNGSRVTVSYVYEWALTMAEDVYINVATSKKDLFFSPGSIYSSKLTGFTFRRAATDMNYGDLLKEGSTAMYRVLYSNGNLIHYCTGNEEEKYTVLDGTQVIGTTAFEGNTHIREVVLPDGLKQVNRAAFKNCTALAAVNYPSSIEAIQGEAFYGCKILTGALDLSAHTALTYIGYSAFQGTNYTSLSLNGCTALTRIENFAFLDTPLTSVDFTGCTALKEIQNAAFRNCRLESLDLTPLTALVSIGQYAFYLNLLKSVDFTANTKLEAIGERAFWGSATGNQITGVDFRNCKSMKTIGNEAFRGNAIKSLTLIWNNRDAKVRIGESAFRDNKITGSLYMYGIDSIGNYAFLGNETITQLRPEKVRYIGESAISNVKHFVLINAHDSFILNKYGDLMSADGTRLLCVDQKKYTKDENGNWVGNNPLFYHDGEDRILPYGITHIDYHAFDRSDVKRAVLPSTLENMPNLDPDMVDRLTIPGSAFMNNENTYGWCMVDSTDATIGHISNFKLYDLPDATKVNSWMKELTSNRGKHYKWRCAADTIFVTPSVLSGIDSKYKTGVTPFPVISADIPVTMKKEYSTFAPDYSCYFDDPIVEIVTRVDMDEHVVYTTALPAGDDGKYHVPARQTVDGKANGTADRYFGVILHGTPGKTYYCHIDEVQNQWNTLFTGSPMVAAPVCEWINVNAQENSNKDMLVLSGGKFRTVQNSGIINWGKGYLLVDKDSSAKPWTMAEDKDIVTGIDIIEDDVTKAYSRDFWHDLTGRRVSKPVKGHIYINNGKAVVY